MYSKRHKALYGVWTIQTCPAFAFLLLFLQRDSRVQTAHVVTSPEAKKTRSTLKSFAYLGETPGRDTPGFHISFL